MINRITLDETSWVEYVPGWLPGPDADELLAKLTANAAWEQRERWMVNRVVIEPRLTGGEAGRCRAGPSGPGGNSGGGHREYLRETRGRELSRRARASP